MPGQTTKVSSEKYRKLTSVTLRIRLAVKTTHPQDLPIHLKSRDAFVYTSIPLFSFFLPRQEEMVPFSEDTRTRNSFYITSSTPANDNNNKHERAICISLILDFQRTKSRREDPVFVISGALCDKYIFSDSNISRLHAVPIKTWGISRIMFANANRRRCHQSFSKGINKKNCQDTCLHLLYIHESPCRLLGIQFRENYICEIITHVCKC